MRKISKDAFVVIGHCPKERGIYGITVDKEKQGQYAFVWAFPLNKDKARKEGFGETSVTGSIVFDEEYPGCPYCGSKGAYFCSCGALVCFNGEEKMTCPKCGLTSSVEYGEEFNLKGGAM